eukprot:TRINITY_DN133312_c1_g2_i1.p1 TRINITY_DN133312_c1_g2~~TRINITY_DN133312_c1_g2_i1.p1  ORF type:complete len:849 (+),score=150.18 TRINITY_DN133312_c1_g2_i1:60-2606(+)
MEDFKKPTVAICAMHKKAYSAPMHKILSRLKDDFKVIVFPEKIILEDPVEDWPIVDVFCAFFSTGFPLEKADAYQKLRKPFCLNNIEQQYVLWDRRKVYKRLTDYGIPVPPHLLLDREKSLPDAIVEEENSIFINNVEMKKPFVEKPISGEDHNVYIYYSDQSGGGSKRLFRKIGNLASKFFPNVSEVRKEGSYIYEKFFNTQGTDVKVYAVGANYAHAEARKSPVVDGIVKRDSEGKEVRYPIILSAAEKEIARKVFMAFDQAICGFDLLRTDGMSYVCDVNGWSVVKKSNKFYADVAALLRNRILMAVAPERICHPNLPLAAAEEQPSSKQPSKKELCCVLAVIRHGDRTPKQKMKMKTTHRLFLNLFRRSCDTQNLPKEVKLKRATELQKCLDASREVLRLSCCVSEFDEEDSEALLDCNEDISKLKQMVAVLTQGGSFAGINRKVQLKPTKIIEIETENGVVFEVEELLVILKWGGVLTHAGREQAESLGSRFRFETYPDEDGFLRLHSTYRHDLKIYSSGEGRVQTTAAAFTKSLLALEGSLTPILVSLVRQDASSTLMLDDSEGAADHLDAAKKKLHSLIPNGSDLRQGSIEEFAPTQEYALTRALERIGSWWDQMHRVYNLIGARVIMLRKLMDGCEHVKVCDDANGGEGLFLMSERWKKLHRDFYRKSTKIFDFSKIPDVYDCIKYDLFHNREIFPENSKELYDAIRPMAEVIVGQEYGLSANHKLRIGSRIAFHLVNKLLIDLDNTQKDLYNGPSFELDTSVDLGDAPLGLSQRKSNLRTRLYFTSESHIHSLMNCIRHCGHNLLSEEGINFMNRVSEFDYLSQIVIKMYQSTDGGEKP